jgi:hypothetical protein
MSLITVVGALLYHAGETLGTANHRAFVAVGVHEVPVLVRGGLKLWTEKPEDLPYVGPVFLVSFLCHVNVLLDSVMMLWSIIGSTICVLIGFTFPSAIWLRLRRDGSAWKVRTAQAIFVSSLVFGVLCTVGAVMNLNRPACPAEVLEASSNATPAIARAGSPAAAAVLAGPNASLPVNASLPLNASLPFSILA